MKTSRTVAELIAELQKVENKEAAVLINTGDMYNHNIVAVSEQFAYENDNREIIYDVILCSIDSIFLPKTNDDESIPDNTHP